MFRVLLALVLMAGPACSMVCAAEYTDLLQRIPDTANALIVLNVEELFDSPLAKAEKWKETYADNYAATPLIVPPEAKRFVLGAELDIESLHPTWEAAAMEMNVDPDLETIAERISGVTDTLAGTDAIWTKNGQCIVKFGPREFALLSPANRQSAARWIKRSADPHDEFSIYLQQAATYASGSGPEMMMAFDLDHLLRLEEVRAAVEASEILKSKDTDQATALLTGVRGLMLGIRIDDGIHGKLIVDFHSDAELIADVAKPLLLKIFANAGAMIDEFKDWQPHVDGKRVSIEGPLSGDSMRRLFSLVALDTAIVNRKPAETATADNEQNLIVRHSLRYFRTIAKYLDDIQVAGTRNQDLSQIALWVNKYARKIEKLPVGYVDGDLVDFADSAAYRLRKAIDQLHGRAQKAQERVGSVRSSTSVQLGAVADPYSRVNYGGMYYQYSYSPMAYANVDVGAAEQRRNIATEEQRKAADESRKIMEEIQYDLEGIRQKMSAKYEVAF